MNSKGKPFFFDENIFEDDIPGKPKHLNKCDTKPEFTKSQMKEMRQQAIEEGKRLGKQESDNAKATEILNLIRSIAHTAQSLHSGEKERINTYETETIHLCESIFRKVLPVYEQHHGLEELKSAISSSLSDYNTPEKINIEIHQDAYDFIHSEIENHQEQFGKEISISAIKNSDLHAFKILWPEGGIVYNRDQIAEKIKTILKETLAERGISVHDEEIKSEPSNPEVNADTSGDTE